MEKTFKDYAAFYLGVEVMTIDGRGRFVTYWSELEMGEVVFGMGPEYAKSYHIEQVKPLLRPLSDIMGEEENEIEGEYGFQGLGEPHLCNALRYGNKYVKDIHVMPGLFLYLLSRSFDIFGLIESGIALDKTKHK